MRKVKGKQSTGGRCARRNNVDGNCNGENVQKQKMLEASTKLRGGSVGVKEEEEREMMDISKVVEKENYDDIDEDDVGS